MTNIFKKKDISEYELRRPKLAPEYLSQMTEYLKRQYPDQSVETIQEFIKQTVKVNAKRPRVKIQDHPRYGVTDEKVVDLYNYTEKLKSDIMTPAGVVYMPPSKKKSILSDTLEESVNLRNVYKHQQLEYAAKGMGLEEQIAKLMQASTKIFNNSIPGAMGTIYSFLFDLPGYNAITSTGRQCVYTGYAHTERMLGGNVYVESESDVINYSEGLLRQVDIPRVKTVSEKYGIHQPSVQDIVGFFSGCLRYYMDVSHGCPDLVSYFSSISSEERTYIFYAYGYSNLLNFNNDLMRSFFDKFFDRTIEVDGSLNPEDIYNVEDDLLAMAMSLNFDAIDREPEMGTAIKKNPDGVRKLLAICLHMEKCILDWEDVLTTFFKIDADMPRLWEHPGMVRRTVIVSDTDSVIFTTDPIVQWYTPEDRFSQDAYDINAFSVFLVSQTLEHLFGRMTTGMGMESAGRKRIKMKNEFYYPIFIRTSLAKHYAGAIHIQEGKILPDPKMDIKGMNFRGSDLPSETADEFDKYVRWVLAELTENSSINVADIYSKISTHEQNIYASLMGGAKTYLPMKSMRTEKEYKIPLVSDYFYAMLWDEVFAEKFGEFVLPNKGLVIPLIKNGVNLPEWREELRKLDPSMVDRLEAFQTKYPKKTITRIILPPIVKEVPEIFRSIMDARSIIFKNGRPFYLLANSMGVGFNDKSAKYIATDFLPVVPDRMINL